ncbi:HNH endonuclease [Microbacterium sp. cx-55]|uniref:HNH endonuclease signature motif containing protein n=1 Tax=unclassified Microbacterium TaxID=2609290 RepID=UPI001CBE77BE|nr:MULTISPECIES: HNH endonuclease signature motif containing protein [unclassified Microbacterium]MBZ4486783.1 HNH endonuclease [Microbacterium sp. cx-55]MCC4907804.1 HNH endonuclease [Microbacterium sp. cx-59]UGB36261.1 HNH endonuclease [Microbacterium sp. cx-55]
MSEQRTLSPIEAEVALLDALVLGVENARSTIAAMQALEVTLMATAAAIAEDQMSRVTDRSTRDREMPIRSLAAEFASALRVSDRTVQRQLVESSAIARRLPLSLAALGEARISRAHLRVIAEAGIHLEDDEARAAFERDVLAVAERETPGRLRPVARRLAERAEPRSLTERHAEASRQRGVFVRDLDDGMSELLAILPSVLAHGAHDRLTQFARQIHDATGADDRDPRTMDELRADLLSDLVLTSTPDSVGSGPGEGSGLSAIRASVRITIPVTSLVGDDGPAELDRSGPIDAATARLLAGSATGWERIFTDRITGCVLAVDRYRPTEQMRRALMVRDGHCRFPGCRMPASRCDLDHTVDHALGGPTAVCNLAHLCRRHHSLKHATAWSVRQLPHGDLEWTSPLGRRYPDTAENRVVFASSVDPPPS